MECDYCGYECGNYGVRNYPEDYRLTSGWVPTSAIRRHREKMQRVLDCGDLASWDLNRGLIVETHHVGPWHDREGRPLPACRHCGFAADALDPTLDHSNCAICIGRLEGWGVISERLQDWAPPDAPLHPDALTAEPVDDSIAMTGWTVPADRKRVELAVKSAFGKAAPAIRWVPSPAELVAVIDARLAGSGFRLTGGGPYQEEGRLRWWSLWDAVAGIRGEPASPDEEAAVPTVEDHVVGVLAKQIARSAFEEPARLHQLLSAAGQFDRRATSPGFLIEQDPRRGDKAGSLIRLAAVLRASCGPAVAVGGEIVISERPYVLRVDASGRPHAEDGPAIAYADGLTVCAWHGMIVPEWIIREPERINIRSIDATENVEVRRVMIERFGAERLIREGGATLVSEDATGRLWRRSSAPPNTYTRWYRPPTDPVTMVEVINSTPEPDGSYKTYFLRVPPMMRSAREAVAWTFGMTAEDYAPVVET